MEPIVIIVESIDDTTVFTDGVGIVEYVDFDSPESVQLALDKLHTYQLRNESDVIEALIDYLNERTES